MSVILAFKCLPTILEAYNKIQFQFINISVDVQVLLNWLIIKEPKVKQKFVCNRLLEAVVKDFMIPVVYHYVNMDDNPADMITRGLSYKKYLSKLKFWLEGPEWLTNNLRIGPSTHY